MMITSTKSSASSINGVCGVNAAAAAVLTSTTSPASSSGSELSPKNGGVGKPVRRRSRASKKTPTTHLNADAASFRAVVQQFTGCHTAATFSRAHKGPINLNFGVRDEADGFDDAVFEMMRYGGNEARFRGDRCRKEQRRWVKTVEEEEERETINEVDDHRGFASSTVSSDAALTFDDLDLDNIPFIEDFSLICEDWNDSSF